MSKKPTKASTKMDFSSIEPQNPRQKQLIDFLRLQDMVIIDGCAGTGKTFITASMAAIMLQAKMFERIIFTRPVVPTGRSIGYMPGDLNEKMAPWVTPFIEIMKRYLTIEEINNYTTKGIIEVVPFEVMRGRNFDDSFIILDEAQNATCHEIKMFLTRIGEYSKTVVLGDSNQSDLHWLQPNEESGLQMAKRLAKNVVGVPVVEFTSEDIVRSDLCKKWIQAFEADHQRKWSDDISYLRDTSA